MCGLYVLRACYNGFQRTISRGLKRELRIGISVTGFWGDLNYVVEFYAQGASYAARIDMDQDWHSGVGKGHDELPTYLS